MDTKYAVLLIAHKNFHQVTRLINKLQHPMVDIFVHCDQRWDEGYNKLKKSDYKNVYIIEDRVCCNLDTWGLIQAPMSMIKKAKEINPDGYRYYMLISGQDYPVVPVEKIIEQLNLSYPEPFLDCTPYTEDNWVHNKFINVGTYNKLSTVINDKIKGGIFRRIIKVIPYIIFKCMATFVYNPRKKLEKMGVGLYGGSAWWILPDIIIDYISDKYEKKDYCVKVLSKTLTPEETFFQVMSMQSPYSELVGVNHCDMVEQNCKTYAYFFDDEKPFSGHPYIFTINEKNKLKKLSDTHFFARKFDENTDKEIFDWIDENLM